MIKKFTFLIVLSLCFVVVCGVPRVKNNPPSQAFVRGLGVDTDQFLQECERAKNWVSKTQGELVVFTELANNNPRQGNLNRAFEWCRKAIFEIDAILKKINGSYDDIMFRFGKIERQPEHNIALQKLQTSALLLREDLISLKASIATFQNQLDQNLK